MQKTANQKTTHNASPEFHLKTGKTEPGKTKRGILPVVGMLQTTVCFTPSLLRYAPWGVQAMS